MDAKKSSSKSVEDLRAMADVPKLDEYAKYNEATCNIGQRVMWGICVSAHPNSCQMPGRRDLEWEELAQ